MLPQGAQLAALLLTAPREIMPPAVIIGIKDTGAVMKRRTWPTRFSQAQEQADPQARQFLEATARNRWIEKLVVVLQSLHLPICETAAWISPGP